MKATLKFDLENEQDLEDFQLTLKAVDYKDAFQDTFKYVRDQLCYQSEGKSAGWVEAMYDVKDRISAIAEENDVEVW